jgi:hypothetical protein
LFVALQFWGAGGNDSRNSREPLNEVGIGTTAFGALVRLGKSLTRSCQDCRLHSTFVTCQWTFNYPADATDLWINPGNNFPAFFLPFSSINFLYIF